MCSGSGESVGIRVDVSFADSEVQGMTCLSLQVLSWQAGRVEPSPSWLLKSQVREPEGGKAAAAEPPPLCFCLRDIPLRASSSSVVKLFPKEPVSVIAHGFLAKAFPSPVGLHLKRSLHADTAGCAGWRPHGGWQQTGQGGWGYAALGLVLVSSECCSDRDYPSADLSSTPTLTGNRHLRFSDAPQWRQVVSFPSALQEVQQKRQALGSGTVTQVLLILPLNDIILPFGPTHSFTNPQSSLLQF